MKKRICLLVTLLALVIMGFTMNAMSVEAAEIIYRGYCGGEGDGKNLTWTLDSDGVLVIEGQGMMKDWTWEESSPYYSDSQPTDWHKHNEKIYSVIVQAGVKNIGKNAFLYCEYIDSIVLPESLLSIGDSAFSICESLCSITLPETIMSIGDSAFSDCKSLASIALPESLTSIGNYAFSSCESLSRITLPESLASIGAGAFSRCESLSNITLPKSLTSIGYSAFSYCTSLNGVVLPDTLTSIDGVFQGCTSLDSIILPESLTSISGTFSGCESLNSIVLPESVTSIDCAFEKCTSLSSITLPKSLTSIGGSAFYCCTNLRSIDLPESLMDIGDWAFCGCESLSSINLPDSLISIGRGGFADCESLSSIELPQSLTSLEGYTFRACRNLSNVVLPESLTTIWEFAFAYCDSLNSIYIPSSVVNIDQAAFVETHLKDIFFGGTKAQWVNMNIIPTDDIDEMYNGLTNATIHYVDYDYEKLNDFVSRLYRNFLKREPDEKGLADWVDVLVSGRGTGAKVVAGFVLSPEYKANSLSNEEYVTALYRIIFNREPDAAGLNAWIGVIENGCTNKKVLAGFVNSEEFNNLCRDLGIARGTYNSNEIADQNVKIAAFVARLYKICLGRSYDQDGLNNWVNALASRTMTGSSVVQGFFGSQEFKNRKLDDTSFVTTAYRSILNREPDPTGLKSWTEALAKGKTHDSVLRGFLKSAEFDNLCAEYRITSGNPRKVKDLGDIIYEGNGDRYYSSDDVEDLSDGELKLARNEIYARRGYIFEDTEMAEYFGRKAWYKPSIPAKDFDEHIFSEPEWRSIQNILSEEEKRANGNATRSEKEWLVVEIERFLSSFAANGFLWSTFSEPGSDVDLGSIVYQVGGIGVDEDTLRRELKREGYIPFTDITYIDSESLDDLLYLLTGYGLYDKKWNLDSLDYLKSIDIYYIEHGDINYLRVRVNEIKSLGNNIYEVKTGPLDEDDDFDWYFRTIRLRRIEAGDYQFISVQ